MRDDPWTTGSIYVSSAEMHVLHRDNLKEFLNFAAMHPHEGAVSWDTGSRRIETICSLLVPTTYCSCTRCHMNSNMRHWCSSP